MITPHGNQGFLVLNYTKYPDVKTWSYAIKKTTTTDSSVMIDYPIRKGLGGKNYDRIPLEYLQNNLNSGVIYSLEATGFNALAEPVITTTIGNLCTGCVPPGSVVWSVECVDASYAWRADVKQAGNQYYIDIEDAIQFYDASTSTIIPHYQYMTFADLNAIIPDQMGVEFSTYSNNQWHYLSFKNYHKCGSFNNIPNLIDVKKVENLGNVDLSDNVRDQFGNILVGEVRGIQKTNAWWQDTPTLGPYDLTSLVGIMPQNSPVNNLPNYEIENLLILANNNSDWIAGNDNYPDLQCPSGLKEYELDGDEPTSGIMDCYTAFLTGVLEDDYSDNNSILEIWDSLLECIGDVSGDIGTEGNGLDYSNIWPVGLNSIQITRVDSLGKFELALTKSMLTDTSSMNIFQLRLEKGLYLISFNLKEGKSLPYYQEIKHDYVALFNQSNLLNTIVYPVPTTKNYMNIKLLSPINIEFSYELLSPDGNRLYNAYYQIRGGTEYDFQINPYTGVLPNGLLSHVFKFRDGSIKTVSSLKIAE